MRTNKITIGILAHVDAGKTTLSEQVLFQSGVMKKPGRVDHGDAFFDTDQMERARGITIFSKQARFSVGDKEVTLLDTPGHVDFSAEMERTLQVLDYAVLVINGADGIQSHTMTLWKLLGFYGIPVFLFVNKMDQPGADRSQLLCQLQKRLDERCVDAAEQSESVWENFAMCTEGLMEEYLSKGTIARESIAAAVAQRCVFPCYFGSALKGEGVELLLEGIGRYSKEIQYSEKFAAKIYKITRDGQGNRLTHMKITGGTLHVKDVITNRRDASDWGTGTDFHEKEEVWQEKADQIRRYSGIQFQSVNEAEAGTVCAVTGLSRTFSGQGLGVESSSDMPVLEPVLDYRIQLPEGCDAHVMLRKLRILEEEEPQLHIGWNERTGEIHAKLMGEIEIEILKGLILQRFGAAVEFGAGTIVYKETIEEAVEGAGHFEPLRHYAEVHLLLEPGAPGSGLQLASLCSEDQLERNWQRLILTHLEEREHPGVMTGSAITDMKISLTAGRGHLKHTEGGDFRQATYRALRQGLMKAKSILLEPVYEFQLEVPVESVGRAMSDVQKMNGSFEPPETEGDMAIITGSAPVSVMRDYQGQVTAYTRGRGRLFCNLKGYEPCRNGQEIAAQIGYDAERDLENPAGSVFCSHGAGYLVSWDEADQHMHVESGLKFEGGAGFQVENREGRQRTASQAPGAGLYVDEKELEEIFTRTYGPIKREPGHFQKRVGQPEKIELPRYRKNLNMGSQEKYLLVDGYNIIFAWEELSELAKTSMEGARSQLIDILGNYQGYKKMTLIVVFDAYRVEGGRGASEIYGGVHVIYTKEAETADQYIEKAVNKLGRSYDVTVATSDNLVQMIIWGEGAQRMSAQGLKDEIERTQAEIRESYARLNHNQKNYPFAELGNQGTDNPEE